MGTVSGGDKQDGNKFKVAERPDQNSIKNLVLFDIGELGRFANPALDWLDSIAESTTQQKEFAADAARKIRLDINDPQITNAKQ